MDDLSCDCSSSFGKGIGAGIGIILGLELFVFLVFLGVSYYKSRYPRSFNFDKEIEETKRTFSTPGFTDVTVERKMVDETKPRDFRSNNNSLNTRTHAPQSTHSVSSEITAEDRNHQVLDENKSKNIQTNNETPKDNTQYPKKTPPESEFQSKQTRMPFAVSLNEFASPRSSREHALMGDLGTGRSLIGQTIFGDLGREKLSRDNIQISNLHVATERTSKEHAEMGDLGAGSSF